MSPRKPAGESRESWVDRQIREAQIVTDTNEHIREANRAALQGPASTVMPLDEEQTVRKWRQGRASEDR